MINNQSIFVVDAHTTGTPIRVVTGGIPNLKGDSITKKMNYMKEHYDWLRTCIMQQPRGFMSLVGAVLVDPCSEEADCGVFYIDDFTYQPMCGAGTLSVAKVLIETGMVKRIEPETKIVLETPSGIVTVFVQIIDGIINNISFENIPAFLYCQDVKINVPDIGELTVDIGFGGNFFTLVDMSQLGIALHTKNINILKDMSRRVLHETNKVVKVKHPIYHDINYMDQILFCNNTPEYDGGYYVQCYFGDAQPDISPCGTGTCTRLAQRYTKNIIELNETYIQKSVYGGNFFGSAIKEVKVDDYVGIVPLISCSDVHITGFNHLVVEENDRLKNGFVTW